MAANNKKQLSRQEISNLFPNVDADVQSQVWHQCYTQACMMYDGKIPDGMIEGSYKKKLEELSA